MTYEEFAGELRANGYQVTRSMEGVDAGIKVIVAAVKNDYPPVVGTYIVDKLIVELTEDLHAYVEREISDLLDVMAASGRAYA